MTEFDDDELREAMEADEPGVFSTADRQSLHRHLDDLLDQANTDPGSVRSMRISTWDGMIKNNDGEPEVVSQYSVRLDSRNIAPAWPVVQPAAPVEIRVSHPRAVSKRHEESVAVILPDPQIGYRFYADNGEYDPFHDVKAMDVALQITADIAPDQVIFLGDYLDLPSFGKYEQEAAFAHTTQKALDEGYKYLATLRSYLPDTDIVLLEGNHDRRIQKMVVRNAMEAFGLRRADDTSGWPVLSLPHLLRLDELNVTYVGGYPAGKYYINDRLKCIHGVLVNSAGSTAKKVVDEERDSTLFGHIHRQETIYRTSDVFEGGRIRLSHTPGCLCRIDGAVPSTRGSTDLSGRPVTRYENWQQGLSVVTYQDGDNPFSIEPVFINTMENYRTSYGGKTYTA